MEALADARRGGDADRPHHLRDPAAGADRAAARRGADRAGRPARADALGVASRRRRRGDEGAGLAPSRGAGRAAGRPSARPARRTARPTASPATSFRPAPRSATTRRSSTGSSQGGFVEPGPATVWMRSRIPVIAGEEISPLGRVLVVADSGNGVSATLDWRPLPLHQRRSERPPPPPARRRVGLPRRGHPARSPTASGSPTPLLFDERGPLGRAAQTLLVAPRG